MVEEKGIMLPNWLLYIIIKVIPVHSTDSQPERAFVNFLVKLYLSAFSRMDSVMTVAVFH